MLKNLCQLEHKVEDKICRFICENDTSLNVIKESLFQFQKYIGQIEDNVKAQQEAAKAETEKSSETSEVPVESAKVEELKQE